MMGGCAARVALTLFAGAGTVESARRWDGEESVDWVTSVTAARNGNPRNMSSPVVSPLDDGTLKKVVSGCHRTGHSLKGETPYCGFTTKRTVSVASGTSGTCFESASMAMIRCGP